DDELIVMESTVPLSSDDEHLEELQLHVKNYIKAVIVSAQPLLSALSEAEDDDSTNLYLSCPKSCPEYVAYVKSPSYYTQLAKDNEWFDWHFCHSFSVLSLHRFHQSSIELFIFPDNPNKHPEAIQTLMPSTKRVIGAGIANGHIFLIDYTVGDGNNITIIDGLASVTLNRTQNILDYFLLSLDLIKARGAIFSLGRDPAGSNKLYQQKETAYITMVC
ncbi:MAG: hypothetical protein ACREOZ_01875, partial [Gloeomargaritales cyanobacterium]